MPLAFFHLIAQLLILYLHSIQLTVHLSHVIVWPQLSQLLTFFAPPFLLVVIEVACFLPEGNEILLFDLCNFLNLIDAEFTLHCGVFLISGALCVSLTFGASGVHFLKLLF